MGWWRGPRAAHQGLTWTPLGWLLIGGRKSQFDIFRLPTHSAVILTCMCMYLFVYTRALSRPWWIWVRGQQLDPVGGRDGSSSRAEIQRGFPTAQVRQKDMHVSTAASWTRSCKVGRLAPLLTRWWWLPLQLYYYKLQTRNFTITTLTRKQDEPRGEYAGAHLQGRAARHHGRPGPDRLATDGASREGPVQTRANHLTPQDFQWSQAR